MRLNTTAFGVIGATIAAGALPALGDDIDLRIENGKIVTHLVGETGDALGPSRVFGGIFNEISGTWFADDPGFQIAPGQLNSGGSLKFAFTQAIRVWDGSDFSSVTSNSVTATYGIPTNTITTPSTDSITANLLLPVQAGGGLHEHPDWELNIAPVGLDPIFYLVQGRLSYAGVQASDPFYIVFGVNADEDQLGSIEAYVRDNLVPTPGSLALFAGLAWGHSRRRR